MLQRQNIDQEGREVLATHKIVMLYVDLVGSHILPGRDFFSVNQEKDSTKVSLGATLLSMHSFIKVGSEKE